MSDFFNYICERRFTLTEGAVLERLRRNPECTLDPELLHAGMIYDEQGHRQLCSVYQEYLQISRETEIPMILFTPTWRTNPQRISASRFADKPVNADCVTLMKELMDLHPVPCFLGGLIGCRGDAYNPAETLPEEEAWAFHRRQASELALAGVHFLLGSTIPALSEAMGMARAMSECGLPYLIGFALDKNGMLLDGTDLNEAISELDRNVFPRPLFYVASCCHPDFLIAAMTKEPRLMDRIWGIEANASWLEACELEGRAELDMDLLDHWGSSMRTLHEKFSVFVLGGCCGTDTRHIRLLAGLTGKAGVK